MAEKNNPAIQEMVLKRTLNAPRELVWELWTDARHVAQWWGPAGFTNPVCEWDAKPGNKIFVTMRFSDGTDHPMNGEFHEVIKPEKLVFTSGKLDGKGKRTVEVINTITFTERDGKTEMVLRAKVMMADGEMAQPFLAGMQAGWGTSLDKLELYTRTRINMMNQLNSNTMAKTSTYLNFAGNTEEAFIFYKSIFKTEFGGKGIQRFGDFPPHEGAPALSDADKKLIIFIELPILGGHKLMGTDAPESMGFKMNFGNNVHIMLEPDTKAETKKLFDALSAGGTVTMDLQDMFWGAYYGSCTDKYGVQWMFNFADQSK